VHVLMFISHDGPCSIVKPVAEDGSDLRRGNSVPNPNRKSLAIPGATVTPRLLTRLPIHGLEKEHVQGRGYSLLSPSPLTRRRRRYPQGRRTMSVHSPQPIFSRSKHMIRNSRILRPHRPLTGSMTWMTGDSSFASRPATGPSISSSRSPCDQNSYTWSTTLRLRPTPGSTGCSGQ
jgi:hypothetical protein